MNLLATILTSFVAGGLGGYFAAYLKYKADIEKLNFEKKKYEDVRNDEEKRKIEARKQMDKYYASKKRLLNKTGE